MRRAHRWAHASSPDQVCKVRVVPQEFIRLKGVDVGQVHSLRHVAHVVALCHTLIVPLLDHLDLKVGQEIALEQLLSQPADVLWQGLHLNAALQAEQHMGRHLLRPEGAPFPSAVSGQVGPPAYGKALLSRWRQPNWAPAPELLLTASHLLSACQTAAPAVAQAMQIWNW